MKKLLISGIVLAASVSLVVGVTTAVFYDSEISRGNTFSAGAIDLKIDNESYFTNDEGDLAFSPSTSWAPKDLNNGELFFNFNDLKPGDVGEDTISLHVETNAAYACMDATLTDTLEHDVTEPEGLVDTTSGTQEGELQDELNFVFWVDDGDNVFEICEATQPPDGEPLPPCIEETTKIVKEGLAKDIFATDDEKWVIADSQSSLFGGPLAPNTPYYIAKAWCFGAMGKTPISQDNVGATGTPGGNDSTNGPLQRGTGFSCDGSLSTNITQTDGIKIDVAFDAVQVRHNNSFVCNPEDTGTLTLVKNVVNNNAGQAEADDWTLSASGPTALSGVSGSPAVTDVGVDPGTYDLSESGGPAGYSASSWDCTGGAQNDGDTVTVAVGDSVVCTITNDDIGTGLTLAKEVAGIEGGSDEQPSAWTLTATGLTGFSGPGPSVSSPLAFLPGTYDLSESGPAGYTASSWVCSSGQVDPDTVNVGLGENVTCTITNTEEEVLSCDAEVDTMLVLDRSGSISSTELATLKTAAHAFVSALSPSAAGAHSGQSSFSTSGTLDLHLTDDEAAAHLAINGITTGGTTDLEAGITLATGELDNGHVHERPAVPDVMIIITDGNPNVPDATTARADAATAADVARAAGIEVYVVGVGSDVDATYLSTDIADDAAHYFAAADFDDLQAILESLIVCDKDRKVYNYVGVTESNDGGPIFPIAFEHDSDVFPWTTATDRNDATPPSNTEYDNIESDNNSYWTSDDPGTDDEMVKHFRFFLTESIANIDDIKILWKGNPEAVSDTRMWALKTGLDEFTPANWVQLGSLLNIPANSDRYIVRHITAGDVGTYVAAVGGQIDIAVSIDVSSQDLQTDFIQLVVTSTP